MSNVKKILSIAAVSAMAATFSTTSIDAAGDVKHTKDDCVTAWATLMVSHPSVHGGFPHQEYKEAILNVIKWNPHWTVGEYEPGVSQKFELTTMDTHFQEGGTAYVAHCGHGSTCNEVARTILKTYPELGSPHVDCVIEPPHVLENPQSF